MDLLPVESEGLVTRHYELCNFHSWIYYTFEEEITPILLKQFHEN
jgi:hypothetical protein